jgi:hypothetical protein
VQAYATQVHASAAATLAEALWLSDEDGDAFDAVNEAVDLFRSLLRTEPDMYSVALSEVLDNRSQMHSQDGDTDAACADSAEAAGLLRPLAGQDELVRSYLTRMLARLGEHLAEADRPAEAREALAEALAVCDQLDAAARDDLAGTAETARDLLDELSPAP